MIVLRLGLKGPEVEQWQNFLVGQQLLQVVSGEFDQNTHLATVAFQKNNNLVADGIAGNTTIGIAMSKGFNVLPDNSNDTTSAAWPPKPNFEALYGDAKREAALGKILYTANEKQELIITNGWDKENIITVDVPQTKGLNFYGKPKPDGKVLFHKKAAEQLKALWAAWEKEGLLKIILTYDGSYCPRFIRGSVTMLSNHAYGTAFDINVMWNQLAQRPALVGQKGSVRELVPLAHQFGFYWGGHFRREDGMHFEIAKIL